VGHASYCETKNNFGFIATVKISIAKLIKIVLNTLSILR